MKKETNISFIDEICEEVAEEFNIKPKEVLEIYLNAIRYIRHLIELPDTYSIVLPYIGTMHLNLQKLNVSIRKRKQYLERGANVDKERLQRDENKAEEILKFRELRLKSKARGKIQHIKLPILWQIRKKTKTRYTYEMIEKINKEVYENK